ncbi:glycosyltransferase family 2 protein [Gryllotalpicola koreensis]|uniref:Glycosyltransferase family 2 protein n=1 Tax=Gryllotalpicola koreensis TaxID=993086 RepID=A0ABP7ZPD9_9MICO
MTLLAEDAEAPIAAVIVAYNSADELPALLRSLEASTVGVHAIVVDNGSADASVALARSFAGVTVVPTGANLGYSGGINVGRGFVRDGQAVAILNPDLVVAPDALERMLASLDREGVGVVAPAIRDAAGGPYRGLFREPSLLGALGETLFGDRWASRPAALSMTVRDTTAYERPGAVDWASGAALLISAACNAVVGAWDDETFFLYWEETDFQRRARAAGFRTVFEPRAVVVHERQASGTSPALEALMAVNRVRYADKHHSRAWAEGMRAITASWYLLRAVRRPELRPAAAMLTSRGRWSELPGAERMPLPLAVAEEHA